MSEHPAWIWRRAHHELSEDLAAIRKNGRFFEGLPIYEQERRWWVALKACGMSGSLNPGAIPIEKIQGRIDAWDAVIANIGQSIQDDPQIAALRQIVQELRDGGLDALEGPWPMPDNLGSGVGWVWALWSDEAARDRLQRVTENALELYVAAVDRYLPRFRRHLRTYQDAITLRFVGFRQSIAHVDPQLMEVPIGWTFAPGSPGVSWRIVEDPQAAALNVAKSASEYRINHGEPHGLYRHRPATLFAMSMLEEDLGAWGWGKHGNLASE